MKTLQKGICGRKLVDNPKSFDVADFSVNLVEFLPKRRLVLIKRYFDWVDATSKKRTRSAQIIDNDPSTNSSIQLHA